MTEQIIAYIEGIRRLAINTYAVDPVIFVGLYIITIPVYYYGLALLIHGLIKQKKSKKALHKNSTLISGLIINFVGWVIPYVYVFIAGRNIPWYVYILLVLYTMVFFLFGHYKKHSKEIDQVMQYFIKSKIRKIKVSKGRTKLIFNAEVINKPLEKMPTSQLKVLERDIEKLINANWGSFDEGFVKTHVLHSDQVLLLTYEDSLVGLASIDKKNLVKRKVYYFEMTVVDKKYESLGLSFIMNFALMKKTIIANIFKGKFGLEFLVITPNMKVLGSLANLASFIYPDPYLFDPIKGLIPDADGETWLMARELIKTSNKPERKLHRGGLVLEGSYEDTPWLIYKKGSQPMYRDHIVNQFGERYLEYNKESGKELVVRVKFTLQDILRGVFR